MRKEKKKRHLLRHILLGFFALAVALAGGVILLLHKLNVEYPEIAEKPAVGEWVRITPEGAKSSDGSEWHGLMRLGTENKVLLFFYGGGVSFNETTSRNTPDWFYIPRTEGQDFLVNGGIFSQAEENPFKDWTFLAVEYATGDFHTGTGEVTVTDEDGTQRTVYHNGYNNYSAFMEEVLPYVGEPEDLVICGSSAGGFATALLSRDVLTRFPHTKNVVACVDSSLLYYDGWKETAETIWHAPQEIADRLTTDNITLDSLVSLHAARPDVKILFACSTRDQALQEYQAYADYGKMECSEASSDAFEEGLGKMVADLQEKIEGSGVYLFACGYDEKTTSTQHQILIANAMEKLNDNTSAADWLMDAVNGTVKSYGLSLLK